MQVFLIRHPPPRLAAGLCYGQTVLARAAMAAGLGWDPNEAHGAVYDTEQTAKLFCTIANGWRGRDCNTP